MNSIFVRVRKGDKIKTFGVGRAIHAYTSYKRAMAYVHSDEEVVEYVPK